MRLSFNSVPLGAKKRYRMRAKYEKKGEREREDRPNWLRRGKKREREGIELASFFQLLLASSA